MSAHYDAVLAEQLKELSHLRIEVKEYKMRAEQAESALRALQFPVDFSVGPADKLAEQGCVVRFSDFWGAIKLMESIIRQVDFVKAREVGEVKDDK